MARSRSRPSASPSKVPYQGVDVAMECTGRFTSKEAAQPLLRRRRPQGADLGPGRRQCDATVVYGVNHKTITKDMTVISNASCTTNCLVPMVKVLHDAFAVERGYMLTCHSYTGDQNLVDALHKDLHRSRAAALSMIPTSTGAARATGLVMPELKGKLDGTSVRVPTPNVSLVSLDVTLAKTPTKDEINAAMKAASEGALKGVLDYSTVPLVSHDFNHSPASCTFDATQTAVVDGTLFRVLGWYDNEWGFSNRMSDTAALLGSALAMALRTLDGVDVAGKRVLLRADLNVPVRDGHISDPTRIERLCPTIRELAEKGARVVVCSHFDRPKGKRVPEMSLAPLAEALGEALGRQVGFAEDCVGAEAEAAVARLADGDVLVLENTRFHAGEEKNAPDFAAALAGLADLYVNDAFSAAHRAHASTEGVAHLLPAYAGRLMQQELDALGAALTHPEHPVMAIVGGSKVSTKLELLGNLVEQVQMLVIGGAMANTFMAAQGVGVGRSLQEADMHATARDILDRAEAADCEVLLPVDAVTATEFRAHAATKTVSIAAIPADAMILDVGPRTVTLLESRLAMARTLVWNGPLGAFETPPFDAATVALARAVADGDRGGAAAQRGRRRRHGGSAAAGRRAGAADLCVAAPAAPFSNGSKARRCRAWRRWAASRRRS